MSDDLVERLRTGTVMIPKEEFDGRGSYCIDVGATDEIMLESADRIEALEADRDKGAKDYCDLMERYDAVCVCVCGA